MDTLFFQRRLRAERITDDATTYDGCDADASCGATDDGGSSSNDDATSAGSNDGASCDATHDGPTSGDDRPLPDGDDAEPR